MTSRKQEKLAAAILILEEAGYVESARGHTVVLKKPGTELVATVGAKHTQFAESERAGWVSVSNGDEARLRRFAAFNALADFR